MSDIDLLLPALLLGSVLRQLRGKRLTPWQLTWPVALVAWAAVRYVRGFPLRTADVLLVVGCAGLGVALGVLTGLATEVRREDDAVVARVGWAGLAIWSVGAVMRLAFEVVAEHGGGPALERFSAAHGLTLGTWAAALTLMALVEVLGRTAVLGPRAIRARGGLRPVR